MAKIWQLNDTLTLFGMETKQFDINFVSNNQSFKAIYFALGADPYMKYLTDVDTKSGVTPYSENFKWMGYDDTDHSAFRTITFETEPEGELLTWLQANAVAQDQPTVTTTRVLYKGKKELTMAQFEALASLDDAVDYDIIDFPNGGITNAQMTAALGYSRLFGDGEIYVCSDNGTYTKGHTYQVKVTGGVKSWEDITPESTPATGTDIQVTELPPASAENAGKIVQFITEKEEGEEPVQGHWYKCKPVVADEGRYEWVKQSVQDKDYIVNTSDRYSSSLENVGRMVYNDPNRNIYWIPYIALGELAQLVNYQGNITVHYTIEDDGYPGGLTKSDEMVWHADSNGWISTTTTGFYAISKQADMFGSETLTKPLYTATYMGNDLVVTSRKITVTSIDLANGTSITIPTGYGEAKFYNYSINAGYSSPIDFYSKFESGNLTDADIEAFRFMAVNQVTVTFDINKLNIETENGLRPLKDYLGGSQNYVPIQSEAEPVALTWRFNDTVDTNRDNDFLVNFTSNGINFTEMGFKWSLQQSPAPKDTMYYSSPTKFQDVYYGQWGSDNEYRTVTFETAPSGELLTWLQANAVPQGEATKTYAQVTNENGAVSIRVFENSDADLQNLSVTKDGVTINGKKPLTSVQPLHKHELVIPYSFSVGDSETVNGSVTYHYLSNTGTQITSASEIDDNFLLSGGIGKNSGSDALTWVINEKPSIPDKMFSVKFTSDAIRYNNIGLSSTGDALPGIPGVLIAYHREEDGMFDQVYEIYQGTERWSSQAYRTLTFETAPSGELLTWLQANAVPQGGADSTTVLLLNVNVIKAGSSITVEAVNASTMGYITGTVGTITDTVTQLI